MVSSLFLSYASEQKAAIATFSAAIARFREQVSIDGHKKIGDMDESLQKLLERVNSNRTVLRSMASAGQEALKELEYMKGKLADDKHERNRQFEEFLMFFNRIYQTLASSQLLDRRSGTCKISLSSLRSCR